MQYAGGKAVSVKTAALTREVLRAMFLTKLKTGAMLVVLLGLVLGGAAVASVWGGTQPKASKDEEQKKLQGTWYTVAVEPRHESTCGKDSGEGRAPGRRE
jgi:hypothetical protein